MSPPPTVPSSVACEPSTDERWFADEVVPHEPMLRAYLHRQFHNFPDLDDVVQESYLRLLRAKAAGSISSIRGFLFTAARNVALDVLRRRRTAASEELVENAPLAVLEDKPGLAETICRDEELDLLAEAIESLPRRCRQVLKLRKIYGLSHRNIALELGISERTVNVQVGLGVRRCAKYLQACGMMPEHPSHPSDETRR